MRNGILAALMFIALLAAAVAVVVLVRIPDMYAVGGVGEIKYTPDMAKIEAGVIVESDDSRDATSRTAEGMRAVLEALKAAGVAESDIATQAIASRPVEQDSDREAGEARKPFYFAQQNVIVTVRDLSKLANVLNVLTDAGSNYWEVAFDIADKNKLEASAHQAALADAMKRADAYASNGGFTRGRILKIVDTRAQFPSADVYAREYYMTADRKSERVTVTGSRSPRVKTSFFVPKPAEQTVTAGVDVLFEIR